jgi:hypothetical protein
MSGFTVLRKALANDTYVISVLKDFTLATEDLGMGISDSGDAIG